MPKTSLLCRRQAPAISAVVRPGRQRADSSPSSSRCHRRLRLRTPTLSSSRRSTSRRPARVIRRASSEPILWTTVLLLPSSAADGELVIKPPDSLLPRPHTCFDIFSPPPPPPSPFLSPSPPSPLEEGMKVLVSVTVEGSPGPVKAMVRLGASVEEAIGAVVDKYRREGRTPKLDHAAAASFQLHRSYFSLESLSKSEKIGEVGGRRFYLRTTCEINNFHFGREDSNLISGGNEIRLQTNNYLAAGMPQSFLASIITRLEKIGNKTKRICGVVACITCM